MNIHQEKIENAILFFTNKSEDKSINRLKLMKLLWLSDKLHLSKYGRLIIKDRYNALPHGPVPSYTLDLCRSTLEGKFKVLDFNIHAEKEFDERFFSKSDLEIMNYVWNKFSDINQFEIRDYSHKFKEWLRFEKELNDSSFPNKYDIVIQDFFEFPDLEEFDDLLNNELIEQSKENFNFNSSIKSYLS